MENGIPASPDEVRAVGLNNSSARQVFEVVGDGTISERRGGGSLRDSEFQIPVPHGNELPPTWFHAIEPPRPGLVLHTD